MKLSVVRARALTLYNGNEHLCNRRIAVGAFGENPSVAHGVEVVGTGHSPAGGREFVIVERCERPN
jgi:hypothetical protein